MITSLKLEKSMVEKNSEGKWRCFMDITPEIVRELLHYDSGTGIITWKPRCEKWFRYERDCRGWNTRYSGKRAGSLRANGDGYQLRQIALIGRHFLEHHVIWMYMTDDPLPEEIDHKNHDGTDNRWCNIRASNHTNNQHNMSMYHNNTSGVTGVHWHRKANKWQAKCYLNGKCHYLGLFTELDEAAMEVMEFRMENGFDPKHGMENRKKSGGKKF